MIDVFDTAAVLAEAERRRKLRAAGATTFEAPESVALPEVDEDALEKEIEYEGDKIMRALGFEVVRFSHPGPTKQTPGISDRRYYRRPRLVRVRGSNIFQPAISCWWEAKSETGRQRPDQKLFQETVEACGEAYVLGTHASLIAWLVAQRIAVVRDGVLEPVAPEAL